MLVGVGSGGGGGPSGDRSEILEHSVLMYYFPVAAVTNRHEQWLTAAQKCSPTVQRSEV